MKNLDEIKAKNPFKVPDGYFEEVNRKVISATTGSGDEKTEPVKSFRLHPYLMVAASIAGFILLSYTGLKIYNSAKTKREIPGLTLSEYQITLMNEIDILTLEESAENMVFTEEVPNVDKSDIIDYLLLENVQLSDIYEQL